MQTINCLKHNKPICIADLTASTLICQRCALFDSNYKNHTFLQANSLKEHALTQLQSLKKGLQTLNFDQIQGKFLKYYGFQHLAATKQQEKLKEVNKVYDEMITQIQAERRMQIQKIKSDISKIKKETSQSLNILVRQKYQKLIKLSQNLTQYLNQQDFFSILNEISLVIPIKQIQSIQKDLCVLQIDLKQRISAIGSNTHAVLPLNHRKSSEKQELLIVPQIQPPSFDIKFSQASFDKYSCASFCRTSNTLKADTSRTRNDESILSIELQKQSGKTKTITLKSEIKDLFVKNTVRTVLISNLNLSNRQALESIRKCTLNSFVSKIDLSNNDLSSQLLIMLKRQKIPSKYLKTIVVKGMKMDIKLLAKEGLRIEATKNNKFSLGDLSIEF